MRVRSFVLVALAGLIACTGASTVPATTVSYTATKASNLGQSPTADPSTGTIYSAFDTVDANEHEVDDVVYVDGKTLATTKKWIFYSGDPGPYYIRDIKVASKSHTVWVEDGEGEDGGQVEEIDGSTGNLIRLLHTDDENSDLTVTASTNTAYVVFGDDGLNPTDSGSLTRIDGTTGEMVSTKLPLTACGEGQSSGLGTVSGITVDSSAGRVYVACYEHVYGFDVNTLKLVSTVTLPYAADNYPKLISDSTTHVVYAASRSTVYRIDEKTNKATLTATLSSAQQALVMNSRPVIDPGIGTLYFGELVLSETTLQQTGTLPYPATYANPTTHNLLASKYVITRKG